MAREDGAEVRERTTVKAITRLGEDGVEVETTAGPVAGRVLIDASGHGTVVGRHLGTRRNMSDPELQKVAYFGHFENVERAPGEQTGHPTIIMADEGWFWLIGLTEAKTSVGFVTRPGFVKALDVPADELLAWAIERCPVVRHRMRPRPATRKPSARRLQLHLRAATRGRATSWSATPAASSIRSSRRA